VETILQELPILPFTLDIARVHSRLWADLLARGEIIGLHDLLIAATALTHGLTLVSGDRRHFGKIADLNLALW
jgi:tRNA(fMet)-specific endonuclease VapC